MKIKLLVIIALLGIGAIAPFGCGGDPGSPGSTGSGDTGVVLDVFVTPFYKGGNTNAVDVIQDDCDDDPEKVDPEYFATHSATATFTARLINTNPPIRPGTLFVQRYTVEFRRSNESVGGPPILFMERSATISIVPPQTGSDPTITTATVDLVDLIRKREYSINSGLLAYITGNSGVFNSQGILIDITGGRYNVMNNNQFENNYTAIFKFYGVNEYGKSFTLSATTNFEIGWYDYCD